MYSIAYGKGSVAAGRMSENRRGVVPVYEFGLYPNLRFNMEIFFSVMMGECNSWAAKDSFQNRHNRFAAIDFFIRASH